MRLDPLRRPASLLLASLLACAGLAVAPGSAGAAPSPLPTDPQAKGYIGLCDEAGHNVTGGSITTRPFVWKAISSVTPPAAYQGRGENVAVNAYQPRPDTIPAQWSTGTPLIAASFYSTRKAPTAQATYKDAPLSSFIHAFPPMVDGLYVLRMHFGKQNYGLYSATYPTTTIQVAGDRWHVVSGGTVDCKTGSAVSVAQITGVAKKKDYTPRAPSAAYVTAAGSGRHSVSAAPLPPGSDGKTPDPHATGGTIGTSSSSSSPAAAVSTNSSGGSLLWLVWVLVAAVVVVGGLVFLLGRLRHPADGSAT